MDQNLSRLLTKSSVDSYNSKLQLYLSADHYDCTFAVSVEREFPVVRVRLKRFRPDFIYLVFTDKVQMPPTDSRNCKSGL